VTTTTAYHLDRWTGDLDGLLTDTAVLGVQADEYLLSTLEQRLLLDGRNDRLNTRQGNYAELSVAVAGLGFGYHFWKSEADLRAYLDTRRFRSLLGPMVGVLATRLAGGVAMPHSLGLEEGEEAGAFVPYAERLFLGGSSSVRGWVPDHLGPQVCSAELCLPEGAQIAAWGSVEYRLDGPVGASLVGFLDLGMAWRDLEAFELSSLQPSAGLGLRYGTPVGPIRIDLAFRLRDDADFAHEPGFNVHAGLSEAF
jgi:outer membrane protein assembly factor BamA